MKNFKLTAAAAIAFGWAAFGWAAFGWAAFGWAALALAACSGAHPTTLRAPWAN